MASRAYAAKSPAKSPFKEPPPRDVVQQQQQKGNSITNDKLGDAIQQLFKKFDKDGNGTVSMEELKLGLESWGITINREAEQILQRIFKNASNANRSEFDEIMRFFLKLRQSFTKFDLDKSNTISITELPHLLKEFNFHVNPQVLNKLMEFFDTHEKSGDLDWQEAVDLMLYILYLDVLFKDEDKDKSGFLSPPELQALLRALNFFVSVSETDIFLRKIPKDKRQNLDFASFVDLLFDMKQSLSDIKEKSREEREKNRSARKILDIGKRKVNEGEDYHPEFKAHKEKYEKLRQQWKSSGKKFEDSEFPCDPKFCFPTNNDAKSSVTCWKRLRDFGPEAELFKNGIDQGDVKQGALGDCWFLSALCVLASYGTQTIEDSFVDYDPDVGILSCRVFKNGKWFFVIIDDRIPCTYAGTPAFGHCRDPNEFWVPLLEKAYAKIHGNFESIEAGSITEGMVDMTGEVSELLDIKKGESWELLKEYTSEGYVMGCAAHVSGGAVEQETPLGILLFHAYGILQTVEVRGLKLLQIRNPWGHHEWKGPWSDGSKEWTPQLMKQLNVTFEDDGTFWMEYSDFCDNFNKLYVLRILTDDIGKVWIRRDFKGEWKGETAGGCVNNSTFPKNPQYVVKTKKDSKVFVSLRQTDLRIVQKKAPEYDSIGFAVIIKEKDNENRLNRLPYKDELLCMSNFIGSREISKEFSTKAGVSYIIIPSRFDPRKEGQYFLSIFSLDNDASITKLEGTGAFDSGSSSRGGTGGSSAPTSGNQSSSSGPSPSSIAGKTLSLHGSWVLGKNSGGCPTQPLWKSSPQYIVEVARTGKVEIALLQEKGIDGKFLHIGFFVFKAEASRKKKINTRDLVFQSDQINLEEVKSVINLEAGTYNILTSTYFPDKEGSYTISVTGACFTNPREFYEITPELDWKSTSISGKWRPGKDGGCSNHRNTFKENPQYLITCDQKQVVKILLETEKDVAVGFYLWTTKDGREPDESLPNSPFISGLSLGKVTCFKDYVDFLPGRYILRATTFDPNIHANFTVQILAEKAACRIVEMN